MSDDIPRNWPRPDPGAERDLDVWRDDLKPLPRTGRAGLAGGLALCVVAWILAGLFVAGVLV